MVLLQSILSLLTPKGRKIWFFAISLGILASILEVASAASFSLLTSSFFGGRNSNLGVLGSFVPFSITQTILIMILSTFFMGKLIVQWVELNLKTKVAEEFFNSSFTRKFNLMGSQFEETEFPSTSVARQMHILTHNIYYPMGMIISESIMLLLLVPFIFLISFKGSLLVFGITLLLSIPSLRVVRKMIRNSNDERSRIDFEIDKISYSKFRSYLDQGRVIQNTSKLETLMHSASDVDRKIVKFGSYSRLIIEFSFIVAIILAFIFIDNLVSPSGRIQFFAILAYSFFRIIPSFSRIMSARNQLSSYNSEFQDLYKVKVQFGIDKEKTETHTSFNSSIEFEIRDLEVFPKTIYLEFGDFVLIQGETGIGKTTLLKSLAGLRSGNFSVKVDNGKSFSPEEWNPNVAVVSQQPFLVGDTLFEMVTDLDDFNEVNLELYNTALNVACLSGFVGKSRTLISNEDISGGERKQIALARAVYSDPEILLLDELTAGMDKNLADEILTKLKYGCDGRVLVMTSHDPEIVKFFSKTIQLMRDQIT
jgi:ABC-type transport system involved in cytochrome bd biosynthesis fused ATPase/permease subunit